MLAELSQLQTQLRRLQGSSASSHALVAAPQAAPAGGSRERPGGDAAGKTSSSGSSTGDGMEQLHCGLFLAAAQQLAAEHNAKVEQASEDSPYLACCCDIYVRRHTDIAAWERQHPPPNPTNPPTNCSHPFAPYTLPPQAEHQVAQLEARLEGLCAPAEQLQQQVCELREALEAAQAALAREQAAAASLLQTNLRLHEAVMALVEQGASAGAAAAAAAVAAEQQQAQRRREPPSAQQRSAARLTTAPKAAGSRLSTASKAAPKAHALERSLNGLEQQLGAALIGAVHAVTAAGERQAAAAATPFGQRLQQEATPKQAKVRPAAVAAALTLSAEHRELLTYHKTLAVELQRTAAAVGGAAAPGKQLALLRQHAQLQEELKGVAARLEDKAVQLAALRGAGLL